MKPCRRIITKLLKVWNEERLHEVISAHTRASQNDFFKNENLKIILKSRRFQWNKIVNHAVHKHLAIIYFVAIVLIRSTMKLVIKYGPFLASFALKWSFSHHHYKLKSVHVVFGIQTRATTRWWPRLIHWRLPFLMLVPSRHMQVRIDNRL